MGKLELEAFVRYRKSASSNRIAPIAVDQALGLSEDTIVSNREMTL